MGTTGWLKGHCSETLSGPLYTRDRQGPPRHGPSSWLHLTPAMGAQQATSCPGPPQTPQA